MKKFNASPKSPHECIMTIIFPPSTKTYKIRFSREFKKSNMKIK